MSDSATDTKLSRQVADLIAEASGGTLSAAEAADESANLPEKGFSSLSFLRLIDALELTFGVYIDLDEDTRFLGRVSGIVDFLKDQGTT